MTLDIEIILQFAQQRPGMFGASVCIFSDNQVNSLGWKDSDRPARWTTRRTGQIAEDAYGCTVIYEGSNA